MGSFPCVACWIVHHGYKYCRRWFAVANDGRQCYAGGERQDSFSNEKAERRTQERRGFKGLRCHEGRAIQSKVEIVTYLYQAAANPTAVAVNIFSVTIFQNVWPAASLRAEPRFV